MASIPVHRIMQEFIEGGLKYNPTILTAFVQLLTKQTGRNVASKVSSQMKALTDMVSTLKGQVLAAVSAAKEAAQVAKGGKYEGQDGKY